jgi:predicted DsbA family dithiol-disulfide isomerase
MKQKSHTRGARQAVRETHYTEPPPAFSEAPPIRVDIYADVVCPWCFIGKRRFERALADFPGAGSVIVTYLPFQLDPHAPAMPRRLVDYLQRRFGDRAPAMMRNVTAAAQDEDISIHWVQALAVNTFEAHRLARLARVEYSADVQHKLIESLFAAHFTLGQDIADQVQLLELGVEAGMDSTRVAAYLESGEGREELQAELDQARTFGIQGVPMFVFNDEYAVEGAQSPDVFQEVLQKINSSIA